MTRDCIWRPIAAEGVIRFDLDEQSRDCAPPSHSFFPPSKREEAFNSSSSSSSAASSQQHQQQGQQQQHAGSGGAAAAAVSPINLQQTQHQQQQQTPFVVPMFTRRKIVKAKHTKPPPQDQSLMEHPQLSAVWDITLRRGEDVGSPRPSSASSASWTWSSVCWYGLGEHCGTLMLNGRNIVIWNKDAYGYGPCTANLYKANPWIIGILEDGRAFGMLYDTTYKCEVDFTDPASCPLVTVHSPTPPPCVLFGPYPHLHTLINTLTRSIGTAPMPPLWSLGYQQCRYSYEPSSQVVHVARKFRQLDIPCDVMWLDIDYMDGYRVFTVDKKKYFADENNKDTSDSNIDKESEDNYAKYPLTIAEMTSKLKKDGFSAVYILDPGVKCEPGYDVYDQGCKLNLDSDDVNTSTTGGAWVLDKPNGQPFLGPVWPGACVFPDYTNKKVREWWADHIAKFMEETQCDGLWNDMNEPALLWHPSLETLPTTCWHRADKEAGGPGYHSQYHNIYGLKMTEASRIGMERARPNQRPFLLTRSSFIGGHRFAAAWTGDNQSWWSHLAHSIPMCLSIAMGGQPFCGPDIGGFSDNATGHLMGRWMGVGSLFPFSRAHSDGHDIIPHEPWAFGKECEKICRLAIKRRYQLMPHFYTLFYEAHTQGLPVMRPVFTADPTDMHLRQVQRAFLLGDSVLVACDIHHDYPHSENTLNDPKMDNDVIPKQPAGPNGWRRFHFEDDLHCQLPRLYLKAGSILPCCSQPAPCTRDLDFSRALLIVSLDANNCAEGVLYEDDGDGYDYKTGGYCLTKFKASMLPVPNAPNKTFVRITASRISGSRTSRIKFVTARVLFGHCTYAEASGAVGGVSSLHGEKAQDPTRTGSHSQQQQAISSEHEITLIDVPLLGEDALKEQQETLAKKERDLYRAWKSSDLYKDPEHETEMLIAPSAHHHEELGPKQNLLEIESKFVEVDVDHTKNGWKILQMTRKSPRRTTQEDDGVTISDVVQGAAPGSTTATQQPPAPQQKLQGARTQNVMVELSGYEEQIFRASTKNESDELKPEFNLVEHTGRLITVHAGHINGGGLNVKRSVECVGRFVHVTTRIDLDLAHRREGSGDDEAIQIRGTMCFDANVVGTVMESCLVADEGVPSHTQLKDKPDEWVRVNLSHLCDDELRYGGAVPGLMPLGHLFNPKQVAEYNVKFDSKANKVFVQLASEFRPVTLTAPLTLRHTFDLT